MGVNGSGQLDGEGAIGSYQLIHFVMDFGQLQRSARLPECVGHGLVTTIHKRYAFFKKPAGLIT
jgi:hypothetical protein